jgi:uncharacterized protein (DUF4415 family)
MERYAGGQSEKSAENSSSSRTPRSKKAALKSTASSRRAKLRVKNVVHTKGRPKLTAEMRRQLDALEAMPDENIDFSDIPEMTEEDTRRTHYVGLHYRPNKESVTIRLDADMIDWFKSQGRGWQTKMNWVLRLYFASHRKTGVKVGRP